MTGVQGYLGQDITTSSAGADPQTLLTESTLTGDTDVIANQAAPNTLGSGGVAEFDGIPNPSIALQGSGTADAPYVAFHLDLSGQPREPETPDRPPHPLLLERLAGHQVDQRADLVDVDRDLAEHADLRDERRRAGAVQPGRRPCHERQDGESRGGPQKRASHRASTA